MDVQVNHMLDALERILGKAQVILARSNAISNLIVNVNSLIN